MTTLDTERLTLRMFRQDDLDAYAAMCADADVMRHLGDGKPLSRADAWRQMAMILGHWQLKGHGVWALEERTTGALVGRAGLFEPEGWPGFELIWMLRRESWGRGYATEAARRILRHAFTDLGRQRVISLIRPANAASIRVAERLGERLEGRTELFGAEALVYAVERAVWRLASRASP
ncbi:MAG: GNAT family N-acetyltransferase [Candidatus Rokuibacteriota bacterium]|nr:MAG: GNAT family N-acetyltransferase [Candidatus Rokubacteria bacterium]